MKKNFCLSLIFILAFTQISFSLSPGDSLEYAYLTNRETHLENLDITGPYRIIEHNGRWGVNPTSIHTRLSFKNHTVNRKNGSVSMWIFPLEDITSYNMEGYMATKLGQSCKTREFLSDQATFIGDNNSRFSLVLRHGWESQLRLKFFSGNPYFNAFFPEPKAYAKTSVFVMEKNRWYNVVATWDFEANRFRVYINGILCASEDGNADRFSRDICGDTLYTGDPSLCVGDVSFFNKALSPANISQNYHTTVSDFDSAYHEKLLLTYAGVNLNKQTFSWEPGPSWDLALDLSLVDESDLDHLYKQGTTREYRIIKDGLHIATPEGEFHTANQDPSPHCYIWTEKFFEGNRYIEYEFKINRSGGLSSLITNASGMKGESFLRDYPRTSNGNMKFMHAGYIRNYHWEYFREMNDERNDLAGFFIMKNPFHHHLGWGHKSTRLDQHVWHKLQYLQIEGRIVCAIDGEIVIRCEDRSINNTGAVLTRGHNGIRLMMNTDMVFRNLKVYEDEKLKILE